MSGNCPMTTRKTRGFKKRRKPNKEALKNKAALKTVIDKACGLTDDHKSFATLLASPAFDVDDFIAKVDKSWKPSALAVRLSATAYLPAMVAPFSAYWLWCDLPKGRKALVLHAMASRWLVPTDGGGCELVKGQPRTNANPATTILRNFIAYPDSPSGKQMASRDGIAFKQLVKDEIVPAKLVEFGSQKGEGLEVWCKRYRQPKKSAKIMGASVKTAKAKSMAVGASTPTVTGSTLADVVDDDGLHRPDGAGPTPLPEGDEDPYAFQMRRPRASRMEDAIRLAPDLTLMKGTSAAILRNPRDGSGVVIQDVVQLQPKALSRASCRKLLRKMVRASSPTEPKRKTTEKM